MGLTQKELGDVCGLSSTSISRFERGTVPGELASIIKLRDSLKLTSADHPMFDEAQIWKSFAGRLEWAMYWSGHSQVSLSKCIDISQPEVSHYLKVGRVDRPRPQHLQPLAYYTNVAYKWLTDGEGEPRVGRPYPLHEFWNSIGDRLVFLLWYTNRNLDLIDIQDHLKVSNSALQCWVNNTRTPSEENIAKITKLFDVPIEWFVHYEDLSSNKQKAFIAHFLGRKHR